jgi:hypothetical protein
MIGVETGRVRFSGLSWLATVTLHQLAKLFTSTKEIGMSKVIINMGYRSIVVDVEAAIEIARLMASAEVYESKYRSAQDGKPSYNTHHIYPMEQDNVFTMQMVTNEAYNMYKLAGKPEER